jgi:hypothetical protein
LDTHIASETVDLYRDSINRLRNFDKVPSASLT